MTNKLKKEIKNYIAEGNKISAKTYLSKNFDLNKLVNDTVKFLDEQIKNCNLENTEEGIVVLVNHR